MSDEGTLEHTEVITRQEEELKEPSMYQVVLLNDDYTTMEFVILVLETVFKKSPSEAKAIMLAVHEQGAGVAGVYTKEIAETKVAITHHLSRQNEFPLKCILEPE